MNLILVIKKVSWDEETLNRFWAPSSNNNESYSGYVVVFHFSQLMISSIALEPDRFEFES